MRFSHLRSSVLPLQNKTILAVDTSANVSTSHTKFERNRFKLSQDIQLQKLAYRLEIAMKIALKFSTQKGGTKAHLGTKFGWNTINSQGVISEYS